jgi:hypothetical protein
MIIDRYNPDWLWYGSGVVCAIAALCYLALHRWMRRRAVVASSTV